MLIRILERTGHNTESPSMASSALSIQKNCSARGSFFCRLDSRVTQCASRGGPRNDQDERVVACGEKCRDKERRVAKCLPMFRPRKGAGGPRNSSILSEVTRRSSPDKTGGNRIAASVRIEAFEGSRWRLRRTRLVCVLNGVLVLRYCILTGIPPCRW